MHAIDRARRDDFMKSRAGDLGFYLYLGNGQQLDGQAIQALPKRIVGCLKVAAEYTVDDQDALEPLDRGHAVPARNHGTQWVAVGGCQALAIHLIRQNYVAAQSLPNRQTARVIDFARRNGFLLNLAAVRSFQNNFNSVRLEA